MSDAVSILVTGVTGYIGGSILTQLLQSQNAQLQGKRFSVLLRGQDRATKLAAAYGARVDPILFDDMDDSARAQEIASQHDIIINAAAGYHPTFAAALVKGLGERKRINKQGSSTTTLFIHTSGTSNVCDQPLTAKAFPEREFDDEDGTAVYDFETAEEALKPYLQRSAELDVIDAGLATGVPTLVIQSPTIFGVGTGLFNTASIQLPMLAKFSRQKGFGVCIGDGNATWDHVHIQDLVGLYELCLCRFLEGGADTLPSGKRGIIFSGAGRHTWGQVAQSIAEAAIAKGLFTAPHVKHLSLEESEELLPDRQLAEMALASNSKTVASVAKRLGWRPTHGPASWQREFHDLMDLAV